MKTNPYEGWDFLAMFEGIAGYLIHRTVMRSRLFKKGKIYRFSIQFTLFKNDIDMFGSIIEEVKEGE